MSVHKSSQGPEPATAGTVVKIQLATGSPSEITAIVDRPPDFRRGETPAFILAPGAGSRLDHPFLAQLATALASEMLVLRFNFPYQEAGRGSPDPQPRLEAAYRAVVAWLGAHPVLAPGPLVIGGKSMGGRIGSHLAAEGLPLAGLALLGYPLHPAGQREKRREAHLPAIRCPILFIQGTRDPLCDLTLLASVRERLGAPHRLVVIPEGDHSFKAPKRAGRSPEEIFALIRDELRAFVGAVARGERVA
jgi:predicted alpha/beta-hydrolase family hydrolase